MSGILQNLQLGVAVCRIGIYTLWRRLCCKGPPVPRPEFDVICLGITGAGKTTILALLAGEDLSQLDIKPTSGFEIRCLQFKDAILNIKEIGGGENVRPYWKHYFQKARGVIFMVDSAGTDSELQEARDALEGVIDSPNLTGLPCLILANCQDKEGARTREQLLEVLDLESLCSDNPWSLQLCSKADKDETRAAMGAIIPLLLPPAEPANDSKGPSKEKDSEDKNNRI